MFAKKTTMEVQFKVYTFWNENDKPEVRRFGIERSVVSSFQYLNAKLQDIYPKLRGKSFTVSWKDEEGDDVTISSDDEIMIALTSMSDDLKKIYVYCKDTTEQSNIDCDIVITGEHSFETGTNIPHGGVVCDGCDAPVTGFRYKCTSCDDYDLCSKCEAAGMHPEHCMVRVPAPTLPRTVIKSAVKRSRHFLKTLNAMNEEHCKRQCNDSGRRRDHSHGHGHHRRQSRDDHNRRSRSSWLETFSTYMNEFANLAGDVVIETGEEGPKPQGNAAPKQTETPKPQTTGAQASASKQSTSAKAQSKQNPKAATSHCEFSGDLNMEKVQKLLNMFLGDNMNAFKPQPSTSNADEEMGQGDRKTSETDKDSVKSEVTSTSNAAERKKDDSPDKTDGWTVINTVKDLAESEAKGSDPARPIGFNLPEEFQERVRISEGQNIYPPLNVATAVLNTKEPEFKEQAAKPSAPEEAKDEAAAKPKAAKPSAKPVDPEHPMAHIQAAIEQMITMGFTNDGGWLTQLLENKDGNIAAVLDLLTPTNPKK